MLLTFTVFVRKVGVFSPEMPKNSVFAVKSVENKTTARNFRAVADSHP
jgi:hypothetical protein